jgi:hypothetical protein
MVCPPDDRHSRFGHFVDAALHDFLQIWKKFRLTGEHCDIQGGQRFPAHCIYIRKRICSGNGAEAVGVIDDRCKKSVVKTTAISSVMRYTPASSALDESTTTFLSVILGSCPSTWSREQVRRTEFRSSAGASCKTCQFDVHFASLN